MIVLNVSLYGRYMYAAMMLLLADVVFFAANRAIYSFECVNVCQLLQEKSLQSIKVFP